MNQNNSFRFKLYLPVLFFILFQHSFSQVKLSDDSIYLVARGTKSKQFLIGEKFNTTLKNITHIGIGYQENDSLKIFNVSLNKKVNNTSLIIESWDEFTNLSDVFYIGVWELKCGKEKLEEIKVLLNNYLETPIEFDNRFNIEDNDKLYCSEFVVKVLNQAAIFDFKPEGKEVTSLLKNMTDKEMFYYFPVDFFLQDSEIKQIYQYVGDIK